MTASAASTTPQRPSSPLLPPKPPKSPKGPRPRPPTTPTRCSWTLHGAGHTTPSRSRPYLTPPRPPRLPIPTLTLVPATPGGDPLSPPSRWDKDPARLGQNWLASPLQARLAYACQQAEERPRPFPSSPTRGGNHAGPVLANYSAAPDADGRHAGLLEDLCYLATLEADMLATTPRNDFFAIIDDVLAAILEEDLDAVNAVVFGMGNSGADLEDRTRGELQALCAALADGLFVVGDELRMFTDDNMF